VHFSLDWTEEEEMGWEYKQKKIYPGSSGKSKSNIYPKNLGQHPNTLSSRTISEYRKRM